MMVQEALDAADAASFDESTDHAGLLFNGKLTHGLLLQSPRGTCYRLASQGLMRCTVAWGYRPVPELALRTGRGFCLRTYKNRKPTTALAPRPTKDTGAGLTGYGPKRR